MIERGGVGEVGSPIHAPIEGGLSCALADLGLQGPDFTRGDPIETPLVQGLREGDVAEVLLQPNAVVIFSGEGGVSSGNQGRVLDVPGLVFAHPRR